MQDIAHYKEEVIRRETLVRTNWIFRNWSATLKPTLLPLQKKWILQPMWSPNDPLPAKAMVENPNVDPGRREEKTAWMQKVTAAYSERDLAKLLDILVKNPLDSVAPYLSLQNPVKVTGRSGSK